MDRVTGVADGREFFGWLEESPQREYVALALFDLDGTAALNDRLGLEEGDRHLARLGKLVLERCASNEVAARFGGQLFALELLEDELEKVMIEVERHHAVLEDVAVGLLV
jgi:diguanylate cyclase (GGDEF)-like protein